MQLTLRYHPAAQRPACAAFLRGLEPAAWLREIGRWQLPAERLRCFLVPRSISSVEPAGLLVVAAEGATLPPDVLEPYGVEAGRLYMPVQATLWPAATPAELARLLLWPQQLWHPGIGLVGFDDKDELDLSTLLSFGPPRPTEWDRARPGLAPKPGLQRIRVQPPTATEVMAAMRHDVSSTPLAQLPKLDQSQPHPGQQLLDGLRRGLLRASLAVVSRLARWPSRREARPGSGWPQLGVLGTAIGVIFGVAMLLWLIKALAGDMDFPWGTLVPGLVILMLKLLGGLRGASADSGAEYVPPSRPARAAQPNKPGALNRVGNWLNANLAKLERQRNNEMERLLRLFAENMDEALRYAIPLNGPYQDRGTAPPTGRLGLRLPEFNLSRLGGGGRADVWDIGEYRQSLQQQYQAAAQREAEAGNHKKAAYIHAHLLGDYHAAAKVLEQGGYFREAAALHQDHLHNRPAAAECLERGGLLQEAADLYADLQQHEKAGDLYQLLDQPALASRHYERGVEVLLGNRDVTEAARLLADKLRQPGRAQEVLLQGWHGLSNQPESCLKQYFDTVAAVPDADLSAHVRDVYQHQTPPERHRPLLQVLADVNQKHPVPALLATSRDIAYDIIGQEASTGNLTTLPLLRHFLPADRLIAGDCHRYAAARQRRPADAAPTLRPQAPTLDSSIEWKAAAAHGQQWVAVGVRDNRLHLARANWYGNVEYYSWLAATEAELHVVLVADEQHGNRILIRPSQPLLLETKHLPKNKYFTEALSVECPSWLPPWPARVALLPDGQTAAARLSDNMLSMNVEVYAADGQSRPHFTPIFDEKKFDGVDFEERRWPCELIYRDKGYHTYVGNVLLRFGKDQLITRLESSLVYHLVSSPYTSSPCFAAAIDGGFSLWFPDKSVKQQDVESAYPATVDIRFVSAEHLVTAGSKAELYHLVADGPELVRTITTPNQLLAVLPTVDRRHFALLETTGRVSLHPLEAE